MRVTLDLDPPALEAARQLAAQRAQSIGEIVSELILESFRSDVPVLVRNGFPVVAAPPGAKPTTLEVIRRADENE